MIHLIKTTIVAFAMLFNQDAQAQQNNDCVRGTAEPTLTNKYFSNHKFTLQSDGLTAIETAVLPNGSVLKVYNEGCEYVNITFEFKTRLIPNSIQENYIEAIRFMESIYPYIDVPLDVESGIHLLKHQTEQGTSLSYNQEIPYGIDDFPECVVLNYVEKLNDTEQLMSLSFILGPL